MKRDIYQTVTDTIIDTLESGTRAWKRPWRDARVHGAAFPHNAVSGRPYSGINVLLLWAQEAKQDYRESAWITFKQAKSLGGTVRKGEKGTLITFWQFRVVDTAEGETTKTIPFIKSYTVFNIEQCDNLALDSINPKRERKLPILEVWENCERFITATGAQIQCGGNRACYKQVSDDIQMPERDQFRTADGYYSTLFHELIHWTSATPRCNRKLGKRFGDRAYAAEELGAELGSAFLGASFQVQTEGRDGIEQHASYVSSWLELLKNDKRAIFTAAAKAKAAVEWLKEHTEQAEEALAA